MNQTDFPLRLGTRASPLAMAQAAMAKSALCAAHGWQEDQVTLCPVTASGDRILDRALADVGGKALWTKELDEALLDRRIDFAVHSMKDVETIRPDALTIAAMLPRADTRDRLVGAAALSDLAQGAVIGTSSPRRRAQLLALRPDLQIVLFRGNVNSRLAKLAAGDVAATLLAAAGLDRLGLEDIGTPLSVDQLLPAPSQGAIGLECRADDESVRALLAAIDDKATSAAVALERAFLAALAADCRSPVAAQAVAQESGFQMRGEILLPDGSERVAGTTHCTGVADAHAFAGALLRDASPALRAYFGH